MANPFEVLIRGFREGGAAREEIDRLKEAIELPHHGYHAGHHVALAYETNEHQIAAQGGEGEGEAGGGEAAAGGGGGELRVGSLLPLETGFGLIGTAHAQEVPPGGTLFDQAAAPAQSAPDAPEPSQATAPAGTLFDQATAPAQETDEAPTAPAAPDEAKPEAAPKGTLFDDAASTTEEGGLAAVGNKFMEELNHPLASSKIEVGDFDLLGRLGKQILQSGEALIVNLPNAIIESGKEAIVQSLKKLGLIDPFGHYGDEKTAENALRRDLNIGVDTLSIALPQFGEFKSIRDAAKTQRELQRAAAAAEARLKNLPAIAEKAANDAAAGAMRGGATPAEAEVIRTQVKSDFWKSQDEAVQQSTQQISTQELLDAPQDIHKSVLNQETQAKAIAAAGRILRLRGIDPTGLSPTRVSDLVMDMIRTEQVPPHEIFLTLHDNDLTLPEFAELFGVTRTEAGRTLKQLSDFQKSLRSQALRGDPAAAEILKTTTGTTEEASREMLPSTQMLSWWRRSGNLFKLALTAQPATAVRNFIDAGGRIGLDVINRAVDTTIQRGLSATGLKEFPQGIKPIDPFGEVSRIFVTPGKTRDQINRLMAAFPEVQDRLFTTLAADVAKSGEGSGLMAGAEKALLFANRLNMAQEYIVRRAVLATQLDRRLRALGTSFDDVVKTGRVPDGFTAMLRDSIKDSLDFTFARTPYDRTAMERVFSGYSKFVNNIPGGTFLEPFPRFLFNATQFISDFMPTGYLKLLSPAERAKVAAGDFSTIGKATAGSAALATALAIRTGNFPGLEPGEKWYEVKTPKGATIDLRPFVTMNPYLYIADMAVRVHDGRLQPGTVTFQNFRRDFLGNAPQIARVEDMAGRAAEAISNIRTPQDFDKLFEFGGEVASGFLTPWRAVNDFASEWFDALRKQREVRGQGPLAPATAILNPTALPERESPTRAATPQTPTVSLPFGLGEVSAGLIKQFSGITVHEPKNAVEHELDRLGFTNVMLDPKTGDDRADALVNRFMGPLLETAGGLVVNLPTYQKLPVEVQSEIMREVVNAARADALTAAKAAAPVTFAGLQLKKQPQIELRAINRLLQGAGKPDLNSIFNRVRTATTAELTRQGL